MFDHIILLFIFLNCITIALERPDIEAKSMVAHTHTETHSYTETQASVNSCPTSDLNLKDKFIRKLKFSHYILTQMPIVRQRNFCSLEHISGASQQNPKLI